MLENVTIVIPAHNRPERLQRLLNYYAETGARILVPDSSDKPFMGEYDRRRVVYRHLPRMHFFLKLREVISLIDTEYVLWCADDDFAVPSGIEAVVDFLDKNPTFSIAQGHYLTFTPTAKGVKFYPRYIRNFDAGLRLRQQWSACGVKKGCIRRCFMALRAAISSSISTAIASRLRASCVSAIYIWPRNFSTTR